MKSFRSLAVISIMIAAATHSAVGKEFFVYFGTYTGPKSKGIYVSKLDLVTGKLTEPVLAAETKSPSFLAVDSKEKFLYAVGETSQFAGKPSGAVSAFSIDPV